MEIFTVLNIAIYIVIHIVIIKLLYMVDKNDVFTPISDITTFVVLCPIVGPLVMVFMILGLLCMNFTRFINKFFGKDY